MSKTLPNFLIVGVARCGTTSLFHYLNQHPEIGFPKKKEPKYFSSLHLKFPQAGPGDQTVDQKMVCDFEEYKQLFNGLGSYPRVGEASSDNFFYHKNTIPEIKKILGDIPIIISLRNPIDRSYSAYNNLVRDDREKLPFKEALKQESRRLDDGWDWMWAYKQGSLYADGLKAFKENFSKVKIVLFEELSENPVGVLSEVEAFLGVKHYDSYDTSVKYSPSGRPKNKLIRMISSRNSSIMSFARSAVMSIMPRKYLEKIAQDFFSKGDLDNEEEENLRKYFSNDLQKTQSIIDKPLKAWRI